jgi:hypothetical protein
VAITSFFRTIKPKTEILITNEQGLDNNVKSNNEQITIKIESKVEDLT